MSDRLRNWIKLQQKLVDDGVKASHLRLDGPDETTWGTWPIDTDGLAEIVEDQLRAWGEEMPKGSHSARLVALDSSGKQTALLPQTIHGSSAVAKSAANEALIYARAHSVSMSTTERQLEAMGNRSVQMEERVLNMLGSVIELSGMVTKMQRDAVEEEVERVGAMARADALVRIADGLAKNAEPLVALVVAHLSDKLEERQAAKAKASNGSSERPRSEPEPRDTDSGDRPDRPEAAPQNGGVGGPANGGRTAKRSRKRASARTQPTTTTKQGKMSHGTPRD